MPFPCYSTNQVIQQSLAFRNTLLFHMRFGTLVNRCRRASDPRVTVFNAHHSGGDRMVIRTKSPGCLCAICQSINVRKLSRYVFATLGPLELDGVILLPCLIQTK